MAIDDDIAFMERVPLLGLLGRPALRVLAIGAETRHVGAGRVLFVAGEAADGAYLIEDGSFSLIREDVRGPAAETEAGRGTLLGEMALMTETLWPATATALDSSIVLRIPRNLFLKMLDGYPESAKRLRDAMLQRATEQMRELEAVRTSLARSDAKESP